MAHHDILPRMHVHIEAQKLYAAMHAAEDEASVALRAADTASAYSNADVSIPHEYINLLRPRPWPVSALPGGEKRNMRNTMH